MIAEQKERGVERHKDCGGPGFHDIVKQGKWRYICLHCGHAGPVAAASLAALTLWNEQQRIARP